jgi:hypothetical protein
MLPVNVIETYKIVIINHSSVFVTEGDTIFGIRITPSNYYQDVPV